MESSLFVGYIIKQIYYYSDKWKQDLNRTTARNGTGGNKLRTYRKFKQMHTTENYLKGLVPRAHRSAFAKFRCGVAPLRIDTGRYKRLRVSADERICIFCQNLFVESKEHVLLSCPLHNYIREKLFREIRNHVDNFKGLSDDKKKTRCDTWLR